MGAEFQQTSHATFCHNESSLSNDLFLLTVCKCSTVNAVAPSLRRRALRGS